MTLETRSREVPARQVLRLLSTAEIRSGVQEDRPQPTEEKLRSTGLREAVTPDGVDHRLFGRLVAIYNVQIGRGGVNERVT
jgi:hypothetical protein